MARKFPDQIVGHFRISDKDQAGVIDLKGRNAKLEIFADENLFLDEIGMSAVCGIARDGSKVTACNCVGSGISGTAFYHETTRHWMTLFPHFVAVGPHHVAIDAKEVSRIEYTFPRATDLFYDHSGFGAMHNNAALAQLISQEVKKSGDVKPIRHYESFYYADRGPIVTINANDVRIEAYNSISYKFPSPRGIRLKNSVKVALDFTEPHKFDDAFRRLHQAHSFFNLVMQSKQPISTFSIVRNAETEARTEIDVYVSNDQKKNTDQLDYRDFLISGGLDREEFESVFALWLGSDEDTRSARRRFLQGFCQRRNYSIDRFLGAANCFDLLPQTSFPGGSEVPEDVVIFSKEAADLARKIVDEGYRNRALGNIGRVKSTNLADKILGRFGQLPAKLAPLIASGEEVIRACVLARNYFVHGTHPKIRVRDVYDFLPFFTDLLEFIFVCTDLNDCGWNAERWISRGGVRCPLREFLHEYESSLKKLREAASNGVRDRDEGSPMSLETKVSSHYSHGSLIAAIDAALQKAGKDPASLRPQDLAPIDEFHVRGREATAELGRHLGLRAGQKVLDVGSGLGGPSRQLAATYGCHITGIDLIAEYCEVANTLAARLKLSDWVRYQQGSALAMPFADATFDAAVTQHVAMNIADKAALYREVARVLKAGGKFGIYDLLQGEGGPVHFPVPWAREPSTSFLATADEMRAHLAAGGFDIVSWNDRSEAGKQWFQGMAKRTAESGPPPLGIHVLLGPDFPAIAKNQVRNLVEDRIRPTEIVCVKRG